MRRFIALAIGLLTLAAGAACAEPAWAPTLRPPPTAPPAGALPPPTILPPATFRPAPLPPAATATPPPTPSPALSPSPKPPTPPAIAPTPTPPPPTATAPPPARPTPRPAAPTLAPPSATRPPPAGYAALPNTAALAQQNPAAAHAIQALPWVADGVAADERDAAAALVNIAIGQDDLLSDLLEKPWLRDGGDFKELGAALAGLNTLSVWVPAAARRIAAMPFLDGLEPADAAALTALSQLVSSDRPAFGEVMSHPTLQGGIGDEAAKIVAVLAGVNWTNPELTPTLLNFAQTTLEERSVALPRAGPITLAIIRTEPGAAGSMDLLEQAVRFAEDYMGETFPRRYVAVLFGPATPAPFAGANFGTHIAIRPEYDRGRHRLPGPYRRARYRPRSRPLLLGCKSRLAGRGSGGVYGGRLRGAARRRQSDAQSLPLRPRQEPPGLGGHGLPNGRAGLPLQLRFGRAAVSRFAPGSGRR